MTDQTIEQAIQDAGANVAPRITPDDIEANIASEHYFTAYEGVFCVIAVENSDSVWETNDGGQIVGDDVFSEIPDQLRLLTFCVLVLRNGFTVTGESACASPQNFKAEIGRQIARENAVQKIWPLLGFALKERLHAEGG